MELGALVCTPRNPRCDVCPLAAGCRARAEGRAASLPRKRPRAERPVVRVVCACITDGARVLVVKRGAGLLAGTWSLPEAVDRGARARPGIARKLAEATGVRVAGVAYRGAVRHVFTHRDVTAELFRVEVDASGPAAPDRRWVSPSAIWRDRRVELRAQDREIGPCTKHRTLGNVESRRR